MTDSHILPAGSIAQYRKVGKVRVVRHIIHNSVHGSVQEYEVVFITGPKKYREGVFPTVWIDAACHIS
jgi:hypothetical protein